MDLLRHLHAAVLAALLSWAATGVALAEDDAIPAKEEPRHRPKLENEYVRILDVEIPAGDQTLFHTHDLNYAYLMVNAALLRNEVKGKPGTVEIKIPAGLVGYYRASEGAYTHRFTNIGTEPFHAIGIELMRPGPSPAVTPPLSEKAGYVTVLDNERVRAYRVVLEPGQSTPSVTLAGPSIRVAGTEGKILQQAPGAEAVAVDLVPARFEFRAGPAAHSLKNVGTARIEIYEFELK
jgi:quercetin dioxygenase-like cupin family protein